MRDKDGTLARGCRYGPGGDKAHLTPPADPPEAIAEAPRAEAQDTAPPEGAAGAPAFEDPPDASPGKEHLRRWLKKGSVWDSGDEVLRKNS